jgi:hypothetical protein
VTAIRLDLLSRDGVPEADGAVGRPGQDVFRTVVVSHDVDGAGLRGGRGGEGNVRMYELGGHFEEVTSGGCHGDDGSTSE